jgi:hypothetical protein
MSNKIPVQIEETNKEVLARIIKATAKKYNCNLVIDFSNGNRKVEFTGDEACKPLIVAELKEILKYDQDANSLTLNFKNEGGIHCRSSQTARGGKNG